MSNNDAIFIARSSVVATDVNGEYVLMDIESGRYFGLDAIGSAIWQQLRQQCSLEELCAALRAGFDGDPSTIDRETAEFMETLVANGLVVSSGAVSG